MVNHVTYRAHEVLDKVVKAKKKSDKINLLKKENNNWALKDILRGTYDEAVQWLLPSGPVPYEPAPFDSHPSEWSQHNKKLAYFVKNGPGQNMLTVKREKMFLDILETIHPRDAELLVNMINKKPIDGVTKRLTKEAFPDLILK